MRSSSAIDDITEEEQARALLVREREYFEKIVDSTRDALLILDFNLRVKRANNTFLRHVWCRSLGHRGTEDL